MPLHKGTQKRIYFEGVSYFVTCVTHNFVEYFKEPIFCELFIEVMKLAKQIKEFDLYAFVVLLDHFHLLFRPHKTEDLPKMMHFIKRHFTRDINYILGFLKFPENEGAIRESLLQKKVGAQYSIYKRIIEDHNKILIKLKEEFVTKYGTNQTHFYKFKWQKSYRDHYIRNNKDLSEHIKYIYNNPFKHKITNAENYKYIFNNYKVVYCSFEIGKKDKGV